MSIVTERAPGYKSPGPELAAARRYVGAGSSVIPLRLDGTKAPAFAGWRVYSDRRPTPAELETWFRVPGRYGIGVPGGPASSNLVVLDFETDAAFRAWAVKLTPGERALLVACPVARTPGGGWHVYIRSTEPVTGCKLARAGDGKCSIETRGNGHFGAAPGSPASVHETGRPTGGSASAGSTARRPTRSPWTCTTP